MQADHRSAGFSLPWLPGFFQRCWPAPVSASLAIYTNLSHLFSKGVHTAGEESGLGTGELFVVQVTTWRAAERGGSLDVTGKNPHQTSSTWFASRYSYVFVPLFH